MDKLGPLEWIYRVADAMEQHSALTRQPTPADFARLLSTFPNLQQHDWSITSDRTTRHNCIAFAAGVTHIKWWPTLIPDPDWYWPPGVPREATLKNFVLAFRTLGYRVCEAGNLEEGYAKIVIYTKDDTPTHAAIQVPSGAWRSKLGDWEDIEHAAPEAIRGQ